MRVLSFSKAARDKFCFLRRYHQFLRWAWAQKLVACCYRLQLRAFTIRLQLMSVIAVFHMDITTRASLRSIMELTLHRIIPLLR